MLIQRKGLNHITFVSTLLILIICLVWKIYFLHWFMCKKTKDNNRGGQRHFLSQFKEKSGCPEWNYNLLIHNSVYFVLHGIYEFISECLNPFTPWENRKHTTRLDIFISFKLIFDARCFEQSQRHYFVTIICSVINLAHTILGVMKEFMFRWIGNVKV